MLNIEEFHARLASGNEENALLEALRRLTGIEGVAEIIVNIVDTDTLGWT